MKLYRVNGTIEELVPEQDTQAHLAQLQKAVGGYIELMPGTGELDVYANEEGRLCGLPVNTRATLLCGYEVLGDVVIMEKGEVPNDD